MPNAYGTTLFCDDIRIEMDGRRTLIGVFDRPIRLPQYPAIVLKLGIITSVVIPRSENLSKLAISIFFPGDKGDQASFFSEFNLTNAINQQKERERNETFSDPDIVKHHKFGQHIIFSPCILKQEGYIKVRYKYNTTTLKIGTLRVEKIDASNLEDIPIMVNANVTNYKAP